MGQVFENSEVLAYCCEEPQWQGGQPVAEYIEACIDAKWAGALGALRDSGFSAPSGLLVADTIVVFERRVLGKPSNPQESHQVLRSLSGSFHEVHSAFRLGRFDGEKNLLGSKTLTVVSKVKFKKLRAAEIDAYVRSGEPADKAGSYGFQGKGIQFVQAVSGSYSGIVGLPLEDLARVAAELDFS